MTTDELLQRWDKLLTGIHKMVLSPSSLETFCGSHNSYYVFSFLFTVPSSPPALQLSLLAISKTKCPDHQANVSFLCILCMYVFYVFLISQAVQIQAL